MGFKKNNGTRYDGRIDRNSLPLVFFVVGWELGVGMGWRTNIKDGFTVEVVATRLP